MCSGIALCCTPQAESNNLLTGHFLVPVNPRTREVPSGAHVPMLLAVLWALSEVLALPGTLADLFALPALSGTLVSREGTGYRRDGQVLWLQYTIV